VTVFRLDRFRAWLQLLRTLTFEGTAAIGAAAYLLDLSSAAGVNREVDTLLARDARSGTPVTLGNHHPLPRFEKKLTALVVQQEGSYLSFI
jgi:hypothetical protein